MKISEDSPLAPFREPRYLTFWLTGISSNFGWMIQLVGASWLMTLIGGSPEMVALVQTSVALPVVLFSLVAGALADTFGRRRMVLYSQFYLAIVSTTLAVFAFYGWLNPWLLLAFTFLIGSGRALSNPAWQTMVREFLPDRHVPAAIALGSAGFNMARTLGPAIGGAIVATVGAFAAFLVNAVANVAVIFVFLGWKKEQAERTLPPEAIGPAIMAGLRYVAMSPSILLVMTRAITFNTAAISVMALMPLVARDLLGGGPEIYGLLLGAFGLGGIAGAFLSPRLRKRLNLEGLARLGFALFAVATAITAMSSVLLLTMVGTAIAGLSWLITLSAFNTTVQLASPRWVVSRNLALYQTASFSGGALGSWLWGYLASHMGLQNALLISMASLAVGGVMGLVFALRDMDDLNLDPHDRWVAPDAAVDLLPRSGPVLTTLEYRIREEDLPEFLRAMRDRRRSRRRDGAHRWTLYRDIERPEFWYESFQTPTWTETQRHHMRRTMADAEIADRLRALHQGPERPRIKHHLIRQANWSPVEAIHHPEQT